MDAKQRAQFINAQNIPQAGSGQSPRICPNCHAEVKGKFCSKCGTKYEEPAPEGQDGVEKQAPAAFEATREPQAQPSSPFEAAKEPQAQPSSPFEATKETQAQPSSPFEAAKETQAQPTSPFEAAKEPQAQPTSPFQPAKEKREISPAVEQLVKRDKKPPRRSFSFNPAPLQAEEIEKEDSALAQGLPEWSIEPPQVVVRRKNR